MKAYANLTHRGQIRRLRRLAESVLPAYDLLHPRLTYLGHGFNTTFCVHAEDEATGMQTEGHTPGRYLLRVHRPGWHGSRADTQSVVMSEMCWLAAIGQDTELVVPWPVRTKAGSYTAFGSHPSVPHGRVCSLLRWVTGRWHGRAPRPVHLFRVGALTAQLHNHVSGWRMPEGFTRHHWNWDALFGEAITFTALCPQDVWSIVPSPYRSVLEVAALAVRPVMEELGQSPEVWGLIHADLHLDNVIFANGEARPIDFDDCGFGYWLYDIAVALWELRLHAHWPAFRQAYLDGYVQHRPVPDDQLRYLDTFIVAREAMIGLATAAATRDYPSHFHCLNEDMRAVAETIQAIMDSSR